MTALVGMISLGKKTLVSIPALVTNELLLDDKALANNCQGSMAQNTIMGYGAPSLGSLAIRPKTKARTSIVAKGRRTLQATPITVCLYRTKISRQAKKKKSSL